MARVVHRAASIADAHVVRQRLEVEGMPAFVADRESGEPVGFGEDDDAGDTGMADGPASVQARGVAMRSLQFFAGAPRASRSATSWWCDTRQGERPRTPVHPGARHHTLRRGASCVGAWAGCSAVFASAIRVLWSSGCVIACV